MIRIKFYDEILMTWKIDKCQTEAEVNNRVGDLRIMEAGGKVSHISWCSESDQQFALRVDPNIYRKAKAKATLEGLSMRDLFTMLLQNYISANCWSDKSV